VKLCSEISVGMLEGDRTVDGTDWGGGGIAVCSKHVDCVGSHLSRYEVAQWDFVNTKTDIRSLISVSKKNYFIGIGRGVYHVCSKYVTGFEHQILEILGQFFFLICILKAFV